MSVLYIDQYRSEPTPLQRERLGNPRDNWPEPIHYTLPLHDGEVKLDLRQLSQYLRGEIAWCDIDNAHMITCAIFIDWMDLQNEKD